MVAQRLLSLSDVVFIHGVSTAHYFSKIVIILKRRTPDVRFCFGFFFLSSLISAPPCAHVAHVASPTLGLEDTYGTASFERLVGAINLC